MKRVLFLAIGAMMAFSCQANADLVIYGVTDGDLSGGNPKSIILCATADIADLSIYGVGSANNGDGSDGEEFTLSGSAVAGDKIVIVGNGDSETFFNDCITGYSALFNNGAANINGDDAVELFQNDSGSSVVIDTFGDINVDGNGEPWEYDDSWAVRSGGSAGAFVIGDWTFGGVNALDGTDEANHKDVIQNTFFSSAPVPEPGSIAVLALVGGIGFLRRRS